MVSDVVQDPFQEERGCVVADRAEQGEGAGHFDVGSEGRAFHGKLSKLELTCQ